MSHPPLIDPPRFEDYLPVDVEQLRPRDSYGAMIEIRERRMASLLGADGLVRPELVEPIDCPLCGAADEHELFHKEGFRFVECADCGLVHVDPQLREEPAHEVYTDESYSEIVERLVASSNDYRRQRFGEERLDIVERFVERGRLLDVGCTTGFVLEAALARGWEAVGVETNPFAAEAARRKGLEVVEATIEQAPLPAGSFDAVTAFDVLEHVRDPVGVLRRIHELLRPGGIVLVYTPNWNCAERLVLGEECHFIWGSNHLVYFAQATLARALETAGFEPVHAETWGLDFDDVLWWLDHTGRYDTRFLADFRHELQFLANGAGWGKNLRMVGSRP